MTGKIHFTMILLLGGAGIMTIGTIIESRESREVAFDWVYGTAWFDFFLFLIALNLVVAVINRIPIRRAQWPFVLTHFSIVLLLIGCWISHTFGYEGRLIVYEGEETRYIFQDGDEISAAWHALDGADPAAGAATERSFASFEMKSAASAGPRLLQSEEAGRPGVRRLRHVPNGVATPALERSGAASPPGVEFLLRDGAERVRGWLFAGEPALRRKSVAAFDVELLSAPYPEMFEFLTSFADSAVEGSRPGPSAPAAELVIEPGGASAPVRIALPEDVGREIPLGEGRLARVERYVPRAQVVGARIEDRSDAPLNPAAIVEVRAGERSERLTVFARFPDYRTNHPGSADRSLVEGVVLRVAKATSNPVLTLIVGPEERLHLRLPASQGGVDAVPLRVGEPVDLGKAGRTLEVTRILPNATTGITVVPAANDRKDARPWVQLEVGLAGERREIWVDFGATAGLSLAGTRVEVRYGQQMRPLPFAIALDEFDIVNHPGSNRPAQYSSAVRVLPISSAEEPRSVVVSMNRPLDHDGFRLFQSSYKLGGNGRPDATILTVSYDPGVMVVYPSFVLLVIGLAWYVQRTTGRAPRVAASREELPASPTGARAPRRTAAALESGAGRLIALLLAIWCASPMPARAAEGPGLPVEETEAWAILADGRIKPLLTFADETALSVIGRQKFQGLGSLDILWGYVLSPEDFKRRPYIRIDSLVLKDHLGLPADEKRFSFSALLDNPKFRTLVSEALAAQAADRSLDRLQRDALEGYAKVTRVSGLVEATSLAIVPTSDLESGWVSPKSLRDASEPARRLVFDEFVKLAAAHRDADADAFRATAGRIGAALRGVDPQAYPAGSDIERELFYRKFNAYGKAWKLYLVSFLAILLLGFFEKRWIHATAMGLLVAGFASQTLGMGLRWAIAGRAPVSNMYESLVFMGWGVVAITLVQGIVYRSRHFAMMGGLMGFLCLAFSENLPIDSAISPLVPVLAHTSWLAVHVMTVMLSYSAFALAMALGHLYLVLMLRGMRYEDGLAAVAMLLYKTVQVGLLFLGAGIICGAVWANESWGRYWGWDPKETWSLITFFVYLALIHARHAGWLHYFGLAVSSILGFLSVLMTYYGVNYILAAGMHSYGFSEGGQFYMLAFTIFELVVVSLAFASRRRVSGSLQRAGG